jgi:hypothetical protein
MIRAEEASQDEKIKEHGEVGNGKDVQSPKPQPADPTSCTSCWPPFVSDRWSFYRHRVISLTTHVQPRVPLTEAEIMETSRAKDDAPDEPPMQRIRMDLPVATPDWDFRLSWISIYIPLGESDEWLENHLTERYFPHQQGSSCLLGRLFRTWIGLLRLIRDSVGTIRNGAVVVYPGGDLSRLDGYIARYEELWDMEAHRRHLPAKFFCGYPAQMAAWISRGWECVPHFCHWFADFPKTLINVTIVVPNDIDGRRWDPEEPRASNIHVTTMANTVDLTYRPPYEPDEPVPEVVVTPLRRDNRLLWSTMVHYANSYNHSTLMRDYEFIPVRPEKRLLQWAEVLREYEHHSPDGLHKTWTGRQTIYGGGVKVYSARSWSSQGLHSDENIVVGK